MMMKEYFSIGEMAKLNYISTHTLRYYDEIDLLKPSYIDEKTGYRYYSYKDFLFLDTIQYLKQFNMSLSEIKKHFETRNIERTLKMWKSQALQIKSQMERLENIQSQVLHNIKNLEESSNILKENTPKIRSLPERYAVLIENRVVTDEEYEISIRKLSHELYNANLSMMGDFMSIKSKQDIEANRYSATISIGNMLNNKPRNRNYNIIDPGEYACIYHIGESGTLGETFHRLIDFIHTSNFEISGDAIEIYPIDLIDTKNTDEYITHIQIPIKKI